MDSIRTFGIKIFNKNIVSKIIQKNEKSELKLI